MDPVDFNPIPPCQIPPVIHTVYIPNKPRAKPQNTTPPQMDTHIELFSRQHSYNHVDYELQKRMFFFLF